MGRIGGCDQIVSDEAVEAVPVAADGVCVHAVWGSDEVAKVPSDGQEPLQSAGFPNGTGFRYSVLTIPAGASDAYHEFIKKSLGAYASSDVAGMHWTPTVDCIVLTQGELELEGDDGKVTVKAGDSVIINGNRHRWANAGPQDAILHAISLGAEASE